MNRLEWTPLAERDLRHAFRFIAQDGEAAARRVVQKIFAQAKYLRVYPSMGRPGRVIGTRELVISGTPLILVYRIEGPVIQIISIMHGARAWPEHF